MRCKHCNQDLDKSVYRDDKKYKSCPNCSQNDGHEHIFYEYPSRFGQSVKRSSRRHPDGPQSHCIECREDDECKTLHTNHLRCSDFG